MNADCLDINRGLGVLESTFDIEKIISKVKESCAVIRNRQEPDWSGATLKPKFLDLMEVPLRTRFTLVALDGRIAYGFEIEEELDGRIAYVWLSNQCIRMPVNNIVTIRDVKVETDGRVNFTYERGMVRVGFQTFLPYFEPGNSAFERPTRMLSVGCNYLNLVPFKRSPGRASLGSLNSGPKS